MKSPFFREAGCVCRMCGKRAPAFLACHQGPVCANCAAVAVAVVFDKLAGAMLAEQERAAV